MELLEEQTASTDSAHSGNTSSGSETSSLDNSPILNPKKASSTDPLVERILPKSPKSSSETDSDDGSPRQHLLTPDEEALYHRLQEQNLRSLESLWAINGPMHQALREETWGSLYFKAFNPTIWLMHIRCSNAEEFRRYLVDIIDATNTNNKRAKKELLHFADINSQLKLVHFITKEVLRTVKAQGILQRGLTEDVEVSLEDFIKLITELPEAEMAELYTMYQNKVTRNLPVSGDLPQDNVYQTLRQLFLGELKDYELFNGAYGFRNYQTQRDLGEKLDSHHTSYSRFNPILQSINDSLADVHSDDLSDAVNRWKTLFQTTSDTQSQQRNLDELVAPSSHLAHQTVQLRPEEMKRKQMSLVELQRQYMAIYHGPIIALNQQHRPAIAEHFAQTHQAATQEIFKFLYFRTPNQIRIAQFLNMPAQEQRYDEFLTAASTLQLATPYKQAMVNAISRFHHNLDNQRVFHANLKKIIIQFGAPKRGIRRFFAFIQTYFQENGADHRRQYREIDELRRINHSLKLSYRENHKEVTAEYLKNIDKANYGNLQTIRVHELERLNALNEKPHFAANKAKHTFKAQLQQAQDPAQINALRKLHRLSQNRRLIRDNIPGIIRQFEQRRANLASQIDTTITENRKPTLGLTPQQKRDLLKQTQYTKTQLHRFMNEVERLRFKADINEEIVAQAVQPVL